MPFFLKTLLVIDILLVLGLYLFRAALAPAHRPVVSAKVVALVLVTPAVALFCGNAFIFCGYLAIVVAFNARSRAELASTYVVLLPTMPMMTVETGVGGIYLLAVSAAAAMGLGALVAFAVGRGGRSLAQPRYDISILLLIGIFVLVANHGGNATIFLRALAVNVFAFAGPYLLVSRGVRTGAQVEHLLLRLMLGATLTSVTGIFQAVKHWVLFEAYYPAMQVPIPLLSWSLAMRAGLLRTGGSMLDYSSAGVFLSAALTLMMLLRARFTTMGFWIVTAVVAGGLVATQSRGAWLAAIVGLLFVAAYRGLWTRAALLVGSAATAGVAILAFATSGRLAALAGTTGEASQTGTYRKQLASRGFDQIASHPFLGQSQDQLTASMPDMVQGQHMVDYVNAHLYVAMTAGLPLFGAWCFIWLSLLARSWKARKTAQTGFDLVEAPAAIVVPVMTALVATSIMDRNLTWPTIALALAGPCFTLARRSRASAGTGQTARRPASLVGVAGVAA